MPSPPKNIDDYLKGVSPAQRKALQKLRKQILSLAPGAEECISYSMPAFREPGGVVAGFLGTNKGCSYFPFSGTTLDSMAADLKGYSRSKSGLHFDPAQGLPLPLLRKLIAKRRAEFAASPARQKASKKRATNKSASKSRTSTKKKGTAKNGA